MNGKRRIVTKKVVNKSIVHRIKGKKERTKSQKNYQAWSQKKKRTRHRKKKNPKYQKMIKLKMYLIAVAKTV